MKTRLVFDIHKKKVALFITFLLMLSIFSINARATDVDFTISLADFMCDSEDDEITMVTYNRETNKEVRVTYNIAELERKNADKYETVEVGNQKVCYSTIFDPFTTVPDVNKLRQDVVSEYKQSENASNTSDFAGEVDNKIQNTRDIIVDPTGRNLTKLFNPQNNSQTRKIAQLYFYSETFGLYNLEHAATGFLVYDNLIVTAAHNVYNEKFITSTHNSKICSKVVASPARTNGTQPYGNAQGYEIYVCENYTYDKINSDYDWAIIKLNSHIGNSTGWFTIRYSETSIAGIGLYFAGYPMYMYSQQNRNYCMYRGYGKVKSNQNKKWGRVLASGSMPMSGQSGGPAYRADGYSSYAYGVLQSHTEEGYAFVKFGNSAFQVILNYME